MLEMTLSDQIEMLRAELEGALPRPLMLLISSAHDGDGAGVVAKGLARSMDSAGYSTLLVLANERTCDVSGTHELKALSEIPDSETGLSRYLVRGSRTNLSIMPLPTEKIRHSVSREAASRFADKCRAANEITIVEASSVLTNAFALLTSSVANGVVVTVREGRRVCKEDRRVANVLSREGSRFLGVVTVSNSVLREVPSTPSRVRVAQAAKVSTVSGEVSPSREEQAV